MPEAWYEIIGPDISLTQGDMIFDCPLLAWQDNTLRLERAESRSLKECCERDTS